MIIKSMSRKDKSFRQLINYMQKGQEENKQDYSFYHNIFNRENIESEFRENANNLRARKNGNYFYHDVVSITRSDELTLKEQKEILYKIINDYIQLRAKRNLVYGVLHEDNKKNLHYHIMISANELNQTKRHRLTKPQFNKIQKDIESFVINNYPKLKQKIIYSQSKKQERTSKQEFELKRRTGKLSIRDQVKEDLINIFNHSTTKTYFFELLQQYKFELYTNGNTIGVKRENRKYRLKTLGLLDDFHKISNIVENTEKQKKQENKQKETIRPDKVKKQYQKEKVNMGNKAGIGEVFEEIKAEVKNNIGTEKETQNNKEEQKEEIDFKQSVGNFFKGVKNAVFGEKQNKSEEINITEDQSNYEAEENTLSKEELKQKEQEKQEVIKQRQQQGIKNREKRQQKNTNKQKQTFKR